jgi:two-component system, sensor histidine kinase PdtaS
MPSAPARASAVRALADECETDFHARLVEPNLRPINGLLALSERPAGLMAVTTVHALLSRISGSTQVCFGHYLRNVCDDLAGTFGGPSGPGLTCAAADAPLSIRSVITLGLIADLLITNALVYAFPPERGGRIAVSFTAGLEAWQLTVEDNGLVMRASGDPRDNGLIIARLLVRQLGGLLEIPGVTAGTRCLVTVPCLTARA